MSDELLIHSDGAKLRTVADWLDLTDPFRNDEVQQDLRRIAERLDALDVPA